MRRAITYCLALFLAAGVLPSIVMAQTEDLTNVVAALDSGPTNQLTKLEQLRMLMEQRQYTSAEAGIREVLRDDPGNTIAEFMLATVMIERQNYDEAISLLEGMIQRHPDEAQIINNYAWILATASDYRYRNPARALELARDAVLLAPDNYHIWSTLAEAHYINGNFEKAVQVLSRGIELAIANKAPDEVIMNFKVQMTKLQDAFVSMSLLE